MTYLAPSLNEVQLLRELQPRPAGGSRPGRTCLNEVQLLRELQPFIMPVDNGGVTVPQ